MRQGIRGDKRGLDSTHGAARVQAGRSSPAPLGVALIPLFWLSTWVLRRADRRGPIVSIASQVGAFGVAMGLIGQAFRCRDVWLARYGSEATYRLALWRAMAGGTAVFWAAVVHVIFVPGGRRPRWTLLPAGYQATSGIALAAAAYRAIGFQALSLRYPFFPQEGPLVTGGQLSYLHNQASRA